MGAAGFVRHYQAVFGDRWMQLEDRLSSSPSQKTVRENAFASEWERAQLLSNLEPMDVSGCYRFVEGEEVTGRDSAGLRAGYVMDAASVQCARALPLEGAERVLDLCAAPGGKSLVLAEALPEGATLVCNDRSPARRQRLKATLAEYLPDEVLSRTRVLGMDGRRIGLRHPAAFDAILLDAPCSSEAHVLRDAEALSRWSIERVRRLARDQYALLTSALLALRPGGSLVYSTCALLRDENDEIIARLLERGRHAAEVVPLVLPGSEQTQHGCQFLPDSSDRGPLYVCRLQKPLAEASAQGGAGHG